MKIVIDIPEKEYEKIKACTAPMVWTEHLIKNGTPLDDIKAEISRKANSGQWSEATVYGMQKALFIIDKHTGGREQDE